MPNIPLQANKWGGMSSKYVIKEETRRAWYGRRYTVFVLYDLSGNELFKSKDRQDVEVIEYLFQCIDAGQE